MQNPKAIELAENILAKTAKEFDADWVIKNLKALREMAREEGDPAVIKILRLAYEHINDNGDFNIGFSSDTDEEEEEVDENEAQITDLEYLLTLVQRSEKEKSKEELKEMKKLLLSLK